MRWCDKNPELAAQYRREQDAGIKFQMKGASGWLDSDWQFNGDDKDAEYRRAPGQEEKLAKLGIVEAKDKFDAAKTFPVLMYQRYRDGEVFFASAHLIYRDRKWTDEFNPMCVFNSAGHMASTGISVLSDQASRKAWIEKQRADCWRGFREALFRVEKHNLQKMEDPSATRDREAMKNRPPVVQTQKPVPTPVERPLCPVGMLNVTPVNAWGRPL